MSGPWSCPVCTFRNEGSCSYCNVCEQPKVELESVPPHFGRSRSHGEAGRLEAQARGGWSFGRPTIAASSDGLDLRDSEGEGHADRGEPGLGRRRRSLVSELSEYVSDSTVPSLLNDALAGFVTASFGFGELLSRPSTQRRSNHRSRHRQLLPLPQTRRLPLGGLSSAPCRIREGRSSRCAAALGVKVEGRGYFGAGLLLARALEGSMGLMLGRTWLFLVLLLQLGPLSGQWLEPWLGERRVVGWSEGRGWEPWPGRSFVWRRWRPRGRT